MFKGTIKTVRNEGRIGYIDNPTFHARRDIFVHINHVHGVSTLSLGMQLSFEVEETDKGPQARNARLVVAKAATRYPPYHFVPPYLQHAVIDKPVFHDGRPTKEVRYSGELHCTLTALTPLLAANDQYSVDTVQDAIKHGEFVELPNDWQVPCRVKADKKVLEPLRLDDGRVVINGAALKGMLRHSFSALLAAPMERVAEHTYSYRPNTKVGGNKRTCHPAVVIAADSETITVKVLPDARDALFVRDNAFSKLGSPRPNTPVRGSFKGLKTQKQRLLSSNINAEVKLDHIYFNYAGGIDGEGYLAGAFQPPVQVYHHVLVEKEVFDNAKEYKISRAVMAHYDATQEHLKDSKTGHLRDEHPLTKNLNVEATAKAITRYTDSVRTPHQLIYVELEDNSEIVSLGHHFRYRWRYADTVRKSNLRTRKILKPLESEVVKDTDESNAPTALSAARLLFGYVSGEQNEGTKKIGRKDFQRFAGRVTFNMAVEVISSDIANNDDERFLNPDKAAVVPLKILGMPRPSAVEFYLNQENTKLRKDGGTLTTYGDILGEVTGELNGRKFYLHQPDAADDLSCYTDETNEVLEGNQATLARFVSKPSTEFRVTLRFRDLRSWELGALLVTLEPEQLVSKFRENAVRLDKNLQDYCQWLEKRLPLEQPLFAHKLGHGRPLGLGSVHIKIDNMNCWSNAIHEAVTNKQDLKNDAIQAFFAKLPVQDQSYSKMITQWLGVHLYRGESRAEYPEKDGNSFNFHTALRAKHLAGRRTDNLPKPEADVLKPLHFGR